VSAVRLLVRTVSELCITMGALIVLLVAYVLFWTGVRADSAMNGEIARLQDQWATTPVVTKATPAPAAYRDAVPFAVMYIPRLGAGWHKPVLQDTRISTLKNGLGHYAGTARLGGVGNFAVAGHRRTYGDPFKDFPKLRTGDKVWVTDGTTWYTYVLDRGPYLTVPADVAVIDPVPAKAGYTVPGRYLTLTTCDPEWGHSHRLIVWGHLAATQPVGQGIPQGLTG
jgi:sortase A